MVAIIAVLIPAALAGACARRQPQTRTPALDDISQPAASGLCAKPSLDASATLDCLPRGAGLIEVMAHDGGGAMTPPAPQKAGLIETMVRQTAGVYDTVDGGQRAGEMADAGAG